MLFCEWIVQPLGRTTFLASVWLGLSNKIDEDVQLETEKDHDTWKELYSALHLVGLRIEESAGYCNQILLVPSYLNRTQKRRLIESFG